MPWACSASLPVAAPFSFFRDQGCHFHQGGRYGKHLSGWRAVQRRRVLKATLAAPPALWPAPQGVPPARLHGSAEFGLLDGTILAQGNSPVRRRLLGLARNQDQQGLRHDL